MNMKHESFFSASLGRDVEYNIYLPENYADGARFPAAYHLHGWQCDEYSDIETMAGIYRARQAITVFPCIPGDIDGNAAENMIMNELIPHIDGKYRTLAAKEGRYISGFSMGGGMAFAFAVKYCHMFSAVTAYAGTYHHFYHPDYSTVGEPAEKAESIYRAMMAEQKFDAALYARYSIIELVMKNAEALRNGLKISLHIGTSDILYCDNEIMRLHLENMGIPHEYVRYEGATHRLAEIL